MPWITMRNAYEIREEFDSRGRCLKRERTIGPGVPWMVVALAAMCAGKDFLPPSFWQFLRH